MKSKFSRSSNCQLRSTYGMACNYAYKNNIIRCDDSEETYDDRRETRCNNTYNKIYILNLIVST